MGFRVGRYETIEPIAAGGMAKVYRGRALADGGFERIVAIKVMHSHLAGDPEFVDMFLDEARLAAKIRHPNVVATHDVKRSPVGTFLVMDYVDGVDLALLQRALRNRSVRLPLELALKIVSDALAGLSAAHELTEADGTPLRLVHRDVSPQNILLDRRTGVVQLTDFGVAHAATRLSTTQAGALKGKLGYLSPEHARDGSVDCRSDIYSMGVLLWEALTGEPLFAGRARVRLLADMLSGKIAAPAELQPSVPVPISAACMKALAQEPDERFQTAREFIEGLRQAAQATGIQLADNETLREFIALSGVEEQTRASTERLDEDESTVVEDTVVESKGPVLPQERKASRKWWYAASAIALSALAASYPLLRRGDNGADPIEVSALVVNQTQPKDIVLPEPRPLPQQNDAPAAVEPLVVPGNDKPKSHRNKKGMYHPRGL